MESAGNGEQKTAPVMSIESLGPSRLLREFRRGRHELRWKADRGLRFVGVCGIARRFKVELANHAVELAGQGGEILEGFDGFFGALGIFDGELRDLAGGLGDFARGGGLLGGGGGDQMDLVSPPVLKTR